MMSMRCLVMVSLSCYGPSSQNWNYQFKGAGVGLNFKPSRSEEGQMNNFQRKPNELWPFGNGKNVESDGSSWAGDSDKGRVCFLRTGTGHIPCCRSALCPIFFTRAAVRHCLVILQGESVRVTLGKQSRQRLQPLDSFCVLTGGKNRLRLWHRLDHGCSYPPFEIWVPPCFPDNQKLRKLTSW